MQALVLIGALAVVLLLASLPGAWSLILPTLVAVGLALECHGTPECGLTILCGFLLTAVASYAWRHLFFVIVL